MDTGIPTSLAHTYANPTAALDAILNVVPTQQRIAQEGQSLAIRDKATDAGIRQEDSRIDLAKAQEERQAQMTSAQVAQIQQGTALDAALFDTNVQASQAKARSTIIASNLVKRDYDRQGQNEPVMASIANDLSNADHEALARGDLDDSFNTRIQGLVGLDAQTNARTSFNAAKQRSFDLIHATNVQEFDPDLRSKFTADFQSAANGAKPWVFDKYRTLQGERDLTRDNDKWNEQVRFDAPSLAIPPERFVMPDGRVDTPGLKAALGKAQALYATDKTAVDTAYAGDQVLINEQVKSQAARLASLDKQTKDVRDDMTRLDTARSRVTDAVQVIPDMPGMPTPKTAEERKKVLDDQAAIYSKQLADLQTQRTNVEKERPHADFQRNVLGLQTAVLNSGADYKRAEQDTSLAPDVREKAMKDASDRATKARADFETFLGRAGSSRIYDGTMRYNPFLPALRGSSIFGD